MFLFKSNPKNFFIKIDIWSNHMWNENWEETILFKCGFDWSIP